MLPVKPPSFQKDFLSFEHGPNMGSKDMSAEYAIQRIRELDVTAR